MQLVISFMELHKVREYFYFNGKWKNNNESWIVGLLNDFECKFHRAHTIDSHNNKRE